MNTQNPTPFRHLTSVGSGSVPPPRPDPSTPLTRALWQQRFSIIGAASRAEILRTAGKSRHAQQVALAEELQRLANEAFNLADVLETEGG